MKIIGLVLLSIFVSCASNSKQKERINKKAIIYYNQGSQELADREFTAALTHLKKADKHDPNNTLILNNLGMAYYFKGAKTIGIDLIKKAIKIEPQNTSARMNLATIYMAMKNFKSAEQQYKQVQKDLTYPAQHKTFYNLGVLYNKTRKPLKAVEYFEKSIAENAGYCPSHYQLGNFYYKRKQFKKALKSYNDATFGLCYNNPIPHYHSAKSLINLNRISKARQTLNMIIEQHGNTKYGKLALVELNKLNSVEKFDYLEKYTPRKKDRKILTPDF